MELTVIFDNLRFLLLNSAYPLFTLIAFGLLGFWFGRLQWGRQAKELKQLLNEQDKLKGKIADANIGHFDDEETSPEVETGASSETEDESVVEAEVESVAEAEDEPESEPDSGEIVDESPADTETSREEVNIAAAIAGAEETENMANHFTLNFDGNGRMLKSEEMILDRAARAIREAGDEAPVHVTGYSKSQGSTEFNEMLANAWASTIADELIAKSEANPGQFSCRGKKPDPETDIGSERRVEIEIG